MSAPLNLDQFDGFTPGPLESPGTDGDARVICYHDGRKRRTLAHVYGERQEANARLYAAAPALLEECRRQREEIARLRDALTAAQFAFGRAGGNHSGGPAPMREAWEAARAALAASEGEGA